MELPLTRNWCREGESNPHRAFAPADFKSAASANFAIPAADRCQYVTVSRQQPFGAPVYKYPEAGRTKGRSSCCAAALRFQLALNPRPLYLSLSELDLTGRESYDWPHPGSHALSLSSLQTSALRPGDRCRKCSRRLHPETHTCRPTLRSCR